MKTAYLEALCAAFMLAPDDSNDEKQLEALLTAEAARLGVSTLELDSIMDGLPLGALP